MASRGTRAFGHPLADPVLQLLVSQGRTRAADAEIREDFARLIVKVGVCTAAAAGRVAARGSEPREGGQRHRTGWQHREFKKTKTKQKSDKILVANIFAQNYNTVHRKFKTGTGIRIVSLCIRLLPNLPSFVFADLKKDLPSRQSQWRSLDVV